MDMTTRIWVSVLCLLITVSAQALSLQGAQELVSQDPTGNVLDWCFALATHDYIVPAPGMLILGNVTYRIENNGTIVRCDTCHNYQ
jgi:hypothetical protein